MIMNSSDGFHHFHWSILSNCLPPCRIALPGNNTEEGGCKDLYLSFHFPIPLSPSSSYDPSQTTLFTPKPCGACSVALTISDISTYEPQVQQMDGDPARPINCSWRKELLM